MLVTFTFTRHPFDRLVSAYEGKLEKGGVLDNALNYFYGKARPRPKYDLTPSQFVQYHIELSYKEGPLNFNQHVKPQYAMCPFCALEFDYVGELQNMSKQMDFLSDILGFRVSCIISITFFDSVI